MVSIQVSDQVCRHGSPRSCVSIGCEVSPVVADFKHDITGYRQLTTTRKCRNSHWCIQLSNSKVCWVQYCGKQNWSSEMETKRIDSLRSTYCFMILLMLDYTFISLLNKLDVGKQIRILNTTQNWVFSKAFRSIAHQTWYMETMLQWTQNWSKINTKLGQGKC